jgi:hypothetical protein
MEFHRKITYSNAIVDPELRGFGVMAPSVPQTAPPEAPRNLSCPMDCVVTGGAGFIGSNLVDALLTGL